MSFYQTAHDLSHADPIDRDMVRVDADLHVFDGYAADGPRGLRRLRDRFAQLWRDHREAQERLAILRQPWTHDQAHWVLGPDGPQLHGETPPPRGQRGPVTSGGWCACHLRPSEELEQVLATHKALTPEQLRAMGAARS